MELKNKILVSVKDGTKVELNINSFRLSGLLKTLVEEYQDDSEIQVPEIRGELLLKIALFLNHYDNKNPKNVLKPLLSNDISEIYGKWEDQFISQFICQDKNVIFELMQAANILDCQSLLDLACSKVAVTIKDLDGQGLLKYFNLKEDMTNSDIQKMDEDLEKEIQEDNSEFYSKEPDNIENLEI